MKEVLPSDASHDPPLDPTEGDESQAKIHPEIAERLGTARNGLYSVYTLCV